MELGVIELDVVINLGLLKDGNMEVVYNDIVFIVEVIGLIVKVILEMGWFMELEKRLVVEICLDVGV